MAIIVIATALCTLAACGKAQSEVAVRVGSHAITTTEVNRWMSVLTAKGSNGHEPGPKAPVPPDYKVCIAELRAHPPAVPTSPIPRQPKAYCEFEYRRFKLKALYLLISYRWVTGEAAELGVKVNKNELRRQLVTFEHALAPSEAAFKRLLGFWRARPRDITLSLELSQLTARIEAKVESAAGKSIRSRKQALAIFGRAFKRKWLARTSCETGYVVPICKQFRTPARPSGLVPPSVPLTDMPAGG
jgi:hypothetical protein